MNRVILLLSLGVVLATTSCMNPFGRFNGTGTSEEHARVTVSTNLTLQRTIVPDFSTAIDSFDVVLTSHDGYDAKSATVTLPATDCTFDSVETGTWDIAVTAKKDGVAVGSGIASDQKIEAGTSLDVVVSVSFYGGTGTGSLSLAFSLPSDTGVDYVEGTIDGSTVVPDLVPNGASLEGTFARTGLSTGSHDLVMTFKRGGATGAVAGVLLEAVNIWANLTSDMWIDGSGQAVPVRVFTAADFLDATASLAQLQVSAGSISFDSATHSYDLGATKASTVTVSATGTESAQYLQYRLNAGGWIELQPGIGSSPVSLTPGANTINVRVTAPDRTTTATYAVTLVRVLTTIDHTNFDPSTLSDAEVAHAAQMNVYFEHASVGGNIFSDSTNGFDTLSSTNPRYTSGHVHRDIWGDLPGTPPDTAWYSAHQEIADWYASNHGLTDVYRGNPGAENKLSIFENSMLWDSLTAHLDIASFKFCYIDTPAVTSGTPDGPTMFAQAKAETEALEAANPGIAFVWWTVPLERDTAYADRQQYNDLVRAYCDQNGKWLLDIADLESHDDSGTLWTMNVGGQDLEVQYSGYSSDGGHLSSAGEVKMAKAYWKMIAEIAKTR